MSLKVVCVSEKTRDQVTATYRIPSERTTVIYSWVEDKYLGKWETERCQPMLVEGDYLLFVGNRFVHKNLRCLVDAYRLVLPEFPALKVVIAGARMRSRGGGGD